MEVSLLTGGSKRTLETVKILHETVLALRTALEGSQKEILQLRSQKPQTDRNQQDDGLSRGIFFLNPMDSPEGKQDPPQDDNKLDSGGESDDIDDIELVFTTGETDPGSIHEDLVPIVEDNLRKSLTNTVIFETDISKCGVLEGDSEMNLLSRRNTLPNPVPYQPILHREILAASRMPPVRSPCKPLLPGTQEMGAQTDITAVPAQWKSETYLAHKMSYNLTTLPSKFNLPVPQIKRLPLSDKTREARRVLLSDINFTSMVPELSRSADHLHDDKNSKNRTSAFEYKSPRTDKYEYARQDSRSNCGSFYGSRCCTSSTSITCEEPRRRHSWRPPQFVCCHARHYWSSVPSSPIKCVHEDDSQESFCQLQLRKRRPRVHFHHCDGRSLPNLRGEGDSGESTDSLLDEAEQYLRRSIDNMIITKSRRQRSNSDTDSISSKISNSSEYLTGFELPKTQPFLPKTVNELKNDCFVKVITPGGRVAVGKVRHAGQVPGKAEPYVGVELANDTGFSDGCFNGHSFFQCETNHAVFVPFRKVVIAWDN